MQRTLQHMLQQNKLALFHFVQPNTVFKSDLQSCQSATHTATHNATEQTRLVSFRGAWYSVGKVRSVVIFYVQRVAWYSVSKVRSVVIFYVQHILQHTLQHKLQHTMQQNKPSLFHSAQPGTVSEKKKV